ncbi:MAG: hypothetical protein ACYTXA_33520 [Nostoc sp.]
MFPQPTTAANIYRLADKLRASVTKRAQIKRLVQFDKLTDHGFNRIEN